MNLKEVHRLLAGCFQKELTNGRKRHIVFWYDEEGEFIDEIDEIHLDNVRIWKVTDYNLFATKYELEKKDPSSHFLLYLNKPKPSPQEDWLYDLYKVGQEFATDKITLTMRELGITDDRLKEIFRSYKTFFNNNKRLRAFQKYPVTSYTEETIDLTVLATLCKTATNTMDDIVRALMRKAKEDDQTAWEDIQKFGDESKFWLLVERYYGYTLPEKSLRSLLIFFMLTYLRQQTEDTKFPKAWERYVSNRPTNVIVFMDQWMNHQDENKIFNALAKDVEKVIEMSQLLKETDVHAWVRMDAFPVFDDKIISYLVQQLTNGLKHFDHYMEIIDRRRRSHWYPKYRHEYQAIFHAVELLEQMEKLDYFIPEQSSEQMFQAYVTKYYEVDTAYRKFYVAYDQIKDKERMHLLRETVENAYVNGFVEELALKWFASRERQENQVWPITGVAQQKDFYRQLVQGYVENDERIFVIVSDALRYEIAKELTDRLNNKKKATTTITAMQSVLPSITKFGMAALLPYKQMSYTNEGKIMLDGIHASGTTNRKMILQKNVPESLAIQYNDIVPMNRDELRETFQGKKVIYIYHNTIDARGDNADTEMEVFQAADEAIDNLLDLVNRLVNNVSASNILVTADHGFTYQRSRLENSQKLPDKPDNAIMTSRRFSISDQKDAIQGTVTYSMNDMLEQENDLFVTVPKGIHRYAIQGAGSNYVHGGGMLQEIVVPVITFKNDRSKSSAHTVKKVDVKLTTPIRKITNTITYLEFLQTEKVEDKRLPLQLIAYFVDEEGNRVSNENIIIADSTSSRVKERIFKEKFVFKSQVYDKQQQYHLILEEENVKKNSIYETYPFIIDITFSNGWT